MIKGIDEKKKIKFCWLLLYIAIIVFSLCMRSKNINYIIAPSYFDLIHTFLEFLSSAAIISIFVFIYYSYPYERNINYLAAGSLFLSSALINTFHIYAFLKRMQCSLIISNVAIIIFCMGIFLSSVLPKKNFKPSRIFIIAPPLLVAFYIIGHILYYSSYNFKINNYTIYLLRFVPLLLIIINAISIYFIIRNIKKYNNRKDGHSYIGGILILNLSFFSYALSSRQNDIYSLMAHVFVLVSIYICFNSFFTYNIKKPYIKIYEAKNKIEEASNIKTDFIVNLSHELRTPINIILSSVFIFNTCKYNSKYIKSIEKSAYRLKKVCENILEFNELENGSVSLNLYKINVIQLMDEILEEANEVTNKKNIDIQFNYSGLEDIITDHDKLVTIILNLFSNSLKYVIEGGKIIIELEIYSKLKLKIINTGPEISPDEIKKLFNKFYKIKDEMVECTEGLGIGLYISKRYSEFLGGNLRIISEGKNTGYELVLPVKLSEDDSTLCVDNNILKGFFSDITA